MVYGFCNRRSGHYFKQTVVYDQELCMKFLYLSNWKLEAQTILLFDLFDGVNIVKFTKTKS